MYLIALRTRLWITTSIAPSPQATRAGRERAQDVVRDTTGELLQLGRARLLDEPQPLDDALVPPHQHRRDQSAHQRERRPEQVERVDQPQRPAADLLQAPGSGAGPARSRSELVHQERAEALGRAPRLTGVRSWRVA